MANTVHFDVRDSPGRGRGLFARTDISKGDGIFHEAPLSTSLPPKSDDIECDWRDSHYVWNLTSLGPLAAFINHSCEPNVHCVWRANITQLAFHAMANISPGTEITMSYLSNDRMCCADRQLVLSQRYGFRCICQTCMLSPEERLKSDRRRLSIGLLIGAYKSHLECRWSAFSATLPPRTALYYVHKARVLAKEEGLSHRVDARFLFDAFRIAVIHSDQARAKIFMKRFLAIMDDCEGYLGPHRATYLRLIVRPADDEFYGKTDQMKSTIANIPKFPSPIDFEKWLWCS